jgi:hypothetical protein
LYWGGVFDGRYVYALPTPNVPVDTTVVRYDTQAAFASAAAWSAFDVAKADASVKGFSGGAFDGRYVYMGGLRTIARYDTRASFSDATGWATYDLSGMLPDAGALPNQTCGAIFDGRYVLFVRLNLGDVPRYDTTAPFADAAAWTLVDGAALDAVGQFCGGAFDGTSAYLTPRDNGTVVRGNVTSGFGAGAPTFDLSTLSTWATGFTGSVFDGRYAYFGPGHNGNHGPLARYDTRAPLGAAASWETLSLTPLTGIDLTFGGSTFDGRFVYFAPDLGQTLVRYDTTAPFTSSSSWARYPGPPSSGALFDGRYVYLIPAGTTFTRFDAKTPPSLPPGYGASFL